MAIHNTLCDLFTNIANAIRSKTGSIQPIVADNFPTEIASLRTGFDYNNQNITSISDYEFYNCTDLKSVDCSNLTSIGTSAFEGCSELKTVTLYEGVTDVGENAFKGCDCIINCKFETIPETWHENWNPDDCLVLFGEPIETWDISKTENDNVTADLYDYNDGYTLVIRGNGDMKDLYISYDGSYNIPWYSHKPDLKHVIISDSVTSIGKFAFHSCSSLTSVTIPKSVTSIGELAFYNCSSLTSITIPDGVTSIGSSAFSGCSGLTSVTILDGVTSIGRYAFWNCERLTSITIPDSVTSIGMKAFEGCSSLTSITIPDSVTSMESYVFRGHSGLRTAGPIGGGYDYEFGWTGIIPQYAFNGCYSLTSITIPDSVTSIGGYAFGDCTSLTSIAIPDSITSIGSNAFYNCYRLTSITIPDSVAVINVQAFRDCSSLTSITYTGTVSKWDTIGFGTEWDLETPDYTIHCTDGDIAKDGTITYHTTE